jgi:hypothetical protein
VTIDASGGSDGTIVDVQGGDESWKLTTGGGVIAQVPGWVPVYPDTEPQGGHAVERDDGVSGGFQLETGDSVTAVIDFFRSRLSADGFSVEVNTISGTGGTQGGLVKGVNEDAGRSVTIMIGSDDGRTSVTVSYRESG